MFIINFVKIFVRIKPISEAKFINNTFKKYIRYTKVYKGISLKIVAVNVTKTTGSFGDIFCNNCGLVSKLSNLLSMSVISFQAFSKADTKVLKNFF